MQPSPSRSLWLLFAASFALSMLSPVVIAALYHWWGVTVERWLPGASSLFFIPFAGAALVCVAFVFSQWETARPTQFALAIVLSFVAPPAGILASLPFVCAIAKECL